MEKDISYQDYIKLENEFKKKEQSMEERLWIDSNVGMFDDVLRSNYNKSVEEFSSVILEYLAKLSNAYQGVFYIVTQEKEILEAVAGYACSTEKLDKKEFKFGEGLVGQAAVSKQEIIFEDLPSNTENGSSVEVQLNPQAVIIIPLLFNESVYGVLKLVFLKTLKEKYKLLLSRTSQNIGAMLESILNSSKLQSLLKDSQENAEVLRAQEEELRQNIEEMQATREAQEKTQNELENLKNTLEKEIAQQTLKLEETIQKFDLATATTTEGLWDLVMPEDLETNDDTYFWWSDNFRKMLGYNNEKDFPNRLASWSDLLHPDHKEETLGAFSAHLMDYSGNTPYNVEYQLLRKNGEYRWYRAVGNTLRDDTGKPLRVAGSLIDIQEAKDLDAVRKDLVEKFDLAIKTTTEGIWDLVMPNDLVTDDDTYFWWSDNLRFMLGYKNEKDFPNRFGSLANLLHPDHKEKTLEAFSAHLMDYSGDTLFDIEYQLLRKTGEYRWYRAVGNTLRDDTGKPLRVAGSLIDIQEAKDLEESKETFEMFENLSNDGFWITHFNGNSELKDDTPFTWSPSLLKLLGMDASSKFNERFDSLATRVHQSDSKVFLKKLQEFFDDPNEVTISNLGHRLKLKNGKFEKFNLKMTKKKTNKLTKVVGCISKA